MCRPAAISLTVALVAGVYAQSAADLRQRAQDASNQIADIVKQGPDASEKSLELLQKLVDELKSINTELKSLKASSPSPKGVTVGGYLQTQYQSTDRLRAANATGPYDAFRVRRVRLNFDADPKDRIHVRASLDTTMGSSQTELRLREAFVRYTAPKGLAITAGQQILPLGYENERSSYEMEFPERTLYNTIYLNGEFDQGVRVQQALGHGWEAQAGLYNALTVFDPEATDRNQGAGDKVGVVGAIRYDQPNARLQVSGFTTKRPAYSPTSAPEADRQFVAVDGMVKIGRPLTLRGEVLTGRDRVPNTAGPDVPMVGWHALASYDLDRHNALAARYQQLDRNKDTNGDGAVGYGLSYTYRWDKDLRLILSHEIFVDSSRAASGQTRYSETVLRLALRF